MISLLDHYKNGEKLYQKVVEEVYKKYQLTYMEFTILMFLGNNPTFDTAKDIVKRRHLAKSHVSSSIKSLEEKHLLSATYLNNDHRTIHLVLNEESKNIYLEGRKRQNLFKEKVLKDFTSEEEREFFKYLDRIDVNILNELKSVNYGK